MIHSKPRFLGLFTDAEISTARTKEKTVEAVGVVLERLRNATEIDTENAAVIAWMNTLQTEAVITAARKTEILGSQSGLGKHNLVVFSGTTFRCTFCNEKITFSAYGAGSPSVDLAGNPPPDPEQWMGVCNG